MTLFTSTRERWLWMGALAVVVAIYSTLALAGTLADTLRDRHLLDATFVAGFLVIILAILATALRRRPGPRELWVIVGIVAVYGMVLVRSGISAAERTHLFEYGLLAVLIHQALIERFRDRPGFLRPAVFAVVTTAIVGLVDEAIQAILPSRVFDPRDAGFNALAAVMAVGASLALAWAQLRSARRLG